MILRSLMCVGENMNVVSKMISAYLHALHVQLMNTITRKRAVNLVLYSNKQGNHMRISSKAVSRSSMGEVVSKYC